MPLPRGLLKNNDFALRARSLFLRGARALSFTCLPEGDRRFCRNMSQYKFKSFVVLVVKFIIQSLWKNPCQLRSNLAQPTTTRCVQIGVRIQTYDVLPALIKRQPFVHVAVSRLRKQIQIHACVYMHVLFINWYLVILRDRFTKNGKEMYRNNNCRWWACKGFVF